jgi:hypothetical protein
MYCRSPSAGRICTFTVLRSVAENTDSAERAEWYFDTDARKVRIGDLQLRRMERFTYEYDFGDIWVDDIRIEATLPIDPAKRYPVCAAGKCSAPPEDCGGPDIFMENRWQYEAMGSGESREELEGLIDDVEKDEWEIAPPLPPGSIRSTGDQSDTRGVGVEFARRVPP